MATYEYKDLVTGEVFEVDQRISDPAFTHRSVGGELFCLKPNLAHLSEMAGVHPVKRLISLGAPPLFVYKPMTDKSGWAAEGYSKAEHKRRADHKLGRS